MGFLFHPEPIVWVQHTIGLGNAEVFRTLTLFGTAWGVLVVLAAAFWLWGRRDAYALAAIAGLDLAVYALCKLAFQVPRPTAPDIVKYEQVAAGSFPSGHVLMASVLWGWLYARGRVPLWLAMLVVAAVGVSRLYLGVHYLADVLAAVLLALALVWVFRRVWPILEPRLSRWPYRAWATLALLASAGAFAGFFAGLYGTNPFQWRAAAFVGAAALALAVEYRYVHRPSPTHAEGRRLTQSLLVFMVLAAFVAVDRSTPQEALWVGAMTAGLAAAWAFLAAPALFAGLPPSALTRRR